jgi:hypothetical protein
MQDLFEEARDKGGHSHAHELRLRVEQDIKSASQGVYISITGKFPPQRGVDRDYVERTSIVDGKKKKEIPGKYAGCICIMAEWV